MAIPTATKTVHHIGEVQEDVQMGIRAEDAIHVLSVLSDLYGNKPLAVLREYSTNAYDSHVQAGVTDPIEVTLPTSTSPTLTIQDHGLGLTTDEIREVYAWYGRSTKRDTNAVAGMLGLGCKSGLAYAPSFTVTAVKNGLKTIAVVTKDEDGRGVIKILDTSATDDRNGVRIQVPVSRVYDFDHAMANDLFKFWTPGTVLIDGKEPDRSFLDEYVKIDDDILVRKTTNAYTKSHVVMGNVPYPVQLDDMAGLGVVAYLPIGSVDFPPSREELQNTSRTRDTLATLSEYVLNRFADSLADKIASATNEWDKVSILWRWENSAGLKRALKKRWVNLSFRSSVVMPPDRVAWSWSPSTWDKRARSTDSLSIGSFVNKNVTVVTGFKAQTLSAQARERLLEWDAQRDGEKAKTFIVVPNGSNIDILDGRENVVSWDDVVAATAKPRPTGGKRGPRQVTMYTSYKNGTMAPPAPSFDEDVILYMTGRLESYDLRRMSDYFPEARVVQLLSKQVPRFVKNHPHATEAQGYLRVKIHEASKAVTKDDRLAYSLNRASLGRIFQAINKAGIEVLDPEVQRLINLVSAPSETLRRAEHFGVSIGGYGTNDEAQKTHQRIISKYPLLGSSTSRYDTTGVDYAIYINSKHEYLSTESVLRFLSTIYSTPSN